MNQVFQMMGGGMQMPFGSPQALKQQFQQFMQGRGGDPNQVLQQMMQSGKVNQQMVNQAQQMANMFGQFLR